MILIGWRSSKIYIQNKQLQTAYHDQQFDILYFAFFTKICLNFQQNLSVHFDLSLFFLYVIRLTFEISVNEYNK